MCEELVKSNFAVFDTIQRNVRSVNRLVPIHRFFFISFPDNRQ
jgi:hypothetical protein